MSPAAAILFNPFDAEYQADPYPTFHRMRSEEPVHWSDRFQAWLLTRHRDVTAAARDPRLASGKRTSSYCATRYQQAGIDMVVMRAFLAMMDRKMDDLDGAPHDRIREIAKPAFRAQALAALTPQVKATAHALVDQAKGRRRFDFMTAFAQPLPWTVICDIIGVPERLTDRILLRQCKQAVSEFFTCPIARVHEAGEGAIGAERGYTAFFREMLREQRGNPGDNLAGQLLRAEAEGAITEEQVIAQLVLFLGAGSSTVTDALANALHAILTHPELMAELRERPELMGGAVDEFLRYNTPLPFMTRVAADDLEIGGARIRKGQSVLLGYGAANRDPEVFTDPDRLDIHRRVTSHLTFGHGAHFCLGASLAKIEMEVVLTAMLREFPGLRLDPEAPPELRAMNLLCRGFHSLPLVV